MLRDERGQVTVFLAMTFLVFLGLAFCVLEGVHAFMESALAEEAFLEAGNDILSRYDKSLFERYHVFFLDPREREYMEKDVRDFLNHYGTSGTYGLRFRDLDVSEEKAATDEKGLFLRTQISEYMKYNTVIQVSRGLERLVRSAKDQEEGRRSGEDDFDISESAGRQPDHHESDDLDDPESVWEEEEEDPEALLHRAQWADLRQVLDQAIHSGILLYALDHPQVISSLRVDTSDLPSHTAAHGSSDKEMPRLFGWNKLSEWRRLFRSEYPSDMEDVDPAMDKDLTEYLLLCFHYFGGAEEKEKTALKYELEYIIAGKNTDQDNLRCVADRIMMMRLFINYQYASRDEKIREEAASLAEDLAGILDFPEGTDAVRTLLIAALSYGESLLELHTLMEGGKVAAVKDSSNWNLSFDNAASRIKRKSSAAGVKKGVSYEDYLRFLLISRYKRPYFNYRIMDMMQLNAALDEPGFRMEDCLYSFRWTGTVLCPRWFVSFPGSKSFSDHFFSQEMDRVVSY